ncbi:MAG: histidine phosphatase family protein [Arcobacteraceae bacterium]
MLKFLIVRHGETVSNAEKRFSGHQDVRLTEKGIWQAEQLSCRLKEETIDIAYSSDLQRAIHTAKIILGDRDIPLLKEPLFKEIHFGNWEGLKWEEIDDEKEEKKYGDWWKKPDLALPEGESLLDLKKRVQIGLDKLIQKHYEEDKKKTIAIVCHGGVAKTIIGIALDIPLHKVWHIRQQSTALNVLLYVKDVGFYVGSVNDIAHLTLLKEKGEQIDQH